MMLFYATYPVSISCLCYFLIIAKEFTDVFYRSKRLHTMSICQLRRDSVDLVSEQDYISNLPRNMKEEILMKLPIKEAVRTSLLSTKWKYAWMSIPNLVFIEDSSRSNLIRLVDQVLSLHRGRILQFKLVIRHVCNEAFNRWMLILSRNGIKNLHIEWGRVEKCCIMHVLPSFIGFKCLRTLKLLKFKLEGISVERLISSCPLLERLELCGIIEYDCLVIRSRNLKWLSIIGKFCDLCLETPNLCFAYINLECYLGDDDNFSLPSKNYKSNILRVLGSLSMIKKLGLYKVFLKYLAIGRIAEALPVPLYRLTEICIDFSLHFPNEVAAAFWLFKCAPKLKVLSSKLDIDHENAPPSALAQSFWEEKGIDSNLFNCLEIVNIYSFLYPKSILKFAKFVLSTAPMLEKLVISEKEIDSLPDADGKELKNKLTSFPRLSKMAKIEFV
ncbi:F-box/FBD/LRR-repeat protein At1g13570-like [Carex rostrata]